jgi:hypothetical protein
VRQAYRSRMPDRVLQNHNCVAALQHRLSHNVIMSPTANEQSDEPVAPMQRVSPASRRRRDRSPRYAGA